MTLDARKATEASDNFLYLFGDVMSGNKDEGLGALDVLFNALEDRDRESGSLSGARRRMDDNITTFDDRDDGTLLNGRGSFKTVKVLAGG